MDMTVREYATSRGLTYRTALNKLMSYKGIMGNHIWKVHNKWHMDETAVEIMDVHSKKAFHTEQELEYSKRIIEQENLLIQYRAELKKMDSEIRALQLENEELKRKLEKYLAKNSKA